MEPKAHKGPKSGHLAHSTGQSGQSGRLADRPVRHGEERHDAGYGPFFP
jgi:hypothetical protein